jgi:superfamily II DNA or RNA helicase
MPRHSIAEPRVQAVVTRLAELVLQLGSVNAVAQNLSHALGGGSARIYPNRIHGVLTDDPARGVNTATLELLERACQAVDTEALPAEWRISPERVRAAMQELTLSGDGNVEAAVAERFGIPVAVVRSVEPLSAPVETPALEHPAPTTPDWSWQEEAVQRSLDALKSGPPKAGLIVPTGGGKTRIALRVALKWLVARDTDEVVLWVTHRQQLKTQARRTLQALIRESELSGEEAAALFERVRFVMVGAVGAAIESFGDALSLMIVDEAHHAAASSYGPVLEQTQTPVLLLTATPNRLDALPIGIDRIAYTITYRELFERGCVIEPIFDPAEDMPDLDWSTTEGLRNLADFLLERTDTDFAKPLVAVSLRERAEILYEAVLEQLDERTAHPLTANDIGFVHGDGNSRGLPNAGDFLDEFAARPAGILIATSQLVGEGFDDPSIDAAVVTYPSTSIGHLMQVAGRALRWTPGKTSAHVVQVRESPLQYHFEQRWLYQDISDALRPSLAELAYSSPEDLRQKVEQQLAEHNVSAAVRDRIRQELATAVPGERLHLMLSGQPYFGDLSDFRGHAKWNAILATPSERERFVRVFNGISARTEDLKGQAKFLTSNHLRPDHEPGSLWNSYADLIPAMEYARREIANVPYYGQASRGFDRGHSTTWLRYVTFEFTPTVPDALEEFVQDAYNRDSVLADYVADPTRWHLALRLELPMFGSEAFLFDQDEAGWLISQLAELEPNLARSPRNDVLVELERWRGSLGASPLPRRVIDQIMQLLRPERRTQHLLDVRELAG